jgi:disease resistance protein RPS2
LAGDAGRILVGVQGTEQGAGEDGNCSHLEAENGMGNTCEGSIQHVDRSFSLGRRPVDAHENRGEATQRIDLVNQSAGFSMEEEEEDGEDNRGRLVQPGAGTSSSRGLKYNTSETRGDPIPSSSTKLVGRAFEENKNVIWSLLMDGKFSTIGIYGMGGVGKTAMIQHIYNKLLKRRDISHRVYWVTVSRDFSINRLQNLIAKRLDLDFSSEDDDLHRAVKLSKELVKKQKWILFLDDLWNSFELHVVGIPVNLKGCKLIITTRSEEVCKRMDSQHKIKLKPLCEREAWTLFMEKLGDDKALSLEVEQIAVDVARECAGLPLGIITVARSLRGVDDLHEWRNTLKKLRESKFKDMENEVFRLLRFSYDQLDDLALQHCLLYCALFPEDYIIERDVLINYLIDEGIMKGMRSSQAAFDEGHTMLNKLENVCLLERHLGGGKFFKMHDLVRDMAIQIQQENSQIMVKAGEQLKELPDAEEWTENLVTVSLMCTQIKKIPSSHSPRCPNLSTLFLCENTRLRFISDSFFMQLHGLKVLNLSTTSIKILPDGISDLVSLTVLLLCECKYLRGVPSLRKLRALKRLDLFKTELRKMPQGMECLSNLWYLRLGSIGKKVFPSGILPQLSHLQFFVSSGVLNVKGKELGCLRKLETLKCHFEGHSDFVEFLRSPQNQTKSLSTYRIFVGPLDDEDYYGMFLGTPSRRKTIVLCNLSINGDGDFQVMFPNDTQKLEIFNCNDGTTLCDISSLIKYATKLEILNIWECKNMESLVLSSWFCSAPPPLPSSNSIFSGLKEFYCRNCKSMKKLLPLVLLPNLEKLVVQECEKMEEIIGTTDEEISSSSSNPITKSILPKLRILRLKYLPELKSICGVKVICDSLEYIEVDTCEKLKRIPICLPLLENGQPSPPASLQNIVAYPEEWWETVVEWEHPNAKDVLLPFVRFRAV